MTHEEEYERPKAILYDNAGLSLADFKEELEQVLASSAFEFREAREFGGAGTPFPTLELILGFIAGVASPIFRSALDELGKDIYHALKGKFFKKPFENDSRMVFIITIVTPEKVIMGHIKTESHNDVIEGMKNAIEMFDDASKVSIVETGQLSAETILDRDKLITERCNVVFHYEYDVSNAKWELKKIAKIGTII
jgi:hypothetical protein